MGKVYEIVNGLVVGGRILLDWMPVGIDLYSDSTKCAGFLIN
jgi:hypothetical protein